MIAALGHPIRGTDASALDVVSELEALREPWSRLAETAGNIFSTWEWNELWWSHYGDGRPLRAKRERRASSCKYVNCDRHG